MVENPSVCGKQFYVKEGRVSRETRSHAHSCPVCHTVVWSSRSFGEIHVKHDTPAGKPCLKTDGWGVAASRCCQLPGKGLRGRLERPLGHVAARGVATCLGKACRRVWSVRGRRTAGLNALKNRWLRHVAARGVAGCLGKAWEGFGACGCEMRCQLPGKGLREGLERSGANGRLERP